MVDDPKQPLPPGSDDEPSLPPGAGEPPLPPPGNDYAEEGYAFGEEENGNGNGFENEGPAVGGSRGRAVMAVVVVGAVLIFLLFMIFGGDDEENIPPSEKLSPERIAAEEDPANLLPPAPVLPPMPEPEIPFPDAPPLPTPPEDTGAGFAPPPPPPLPTEPDMPTIFADEGPPVEDPMDERRRSPILMLDSGATDAEAEAETADEENGGFFGTGSNASFGNTVANAKVAEVRARQIGNLNNRILQGKLIDAVIESAINTSLDAPLRAIVSRDVFAEAGREVLIPKGSRLIGAYSTDILRGQGRVYIIWSRVIRPDGVDLMIGSPGVDSLGRGGIEGMVDNRYFELYSNAILNSLVTIGAGYAGEQLGGGNVTTTTSGLGGSTQSGSPSALATLEAVNNLGDVSSGILEGMMNIAPVIRVDQGHPVKVFVNKDLIFPSDLVGGTRILP